MYYIGNHLPVANGYEVMAKMELELGGNTFAFFTRNPRGSKAKEIDIKDIQKFLKIIDENGFGRLVAHAPYTLNLCSDKEKTRNFSKEVLADDIKRMEYIPGNYYNFHPGSHTGQGTEKGIGIIADVLNEVLSPGQTTIVLLETMAGKGTEIGRTFEEIKEIMDRVTLKDKLGVCFDTCHIWDGGYDIVNNLDGVINEFDRVIGLKNLYAIHFNDSKNECGSHKDRHERIGYGKIGAVALKRIALHPAFAGKPFILETPNDDKGYIHEIEMFKKWMEEKQ